MGRTRDGIARGLRSRIAGEHVVCYGLSEQAITIACILH